jgi:GntR family transcriptional regulator, transcriptional repressor for pyruvate dehydrogenase complex
MLAPSWRAADPDQWLAASRHAMVTFTGSSYDGDPPRLRKGCDRMSAEDAPSRRMRAPKLADIVAGKLRAWIVRHALNEGDLLPTLERLAASFGVSLQVVREAIRILETEDLLEIRRGHVGGVAVKAPSLEAVSRSVGVYLQYHDATVDDVLTARRLIEPFAAAQLAARPTPEIISTLEALIRRTEAAMLDSRQYALSVTNLHQTIVTLTGNKTLSVTHAAVVQAIRNNIAKLGSRKSLNIENRKNNLKSYNKLLSLIADGDVAGAEEHMRQHLENTARTYFKYAHADEVVDLFTAPDEAPPLAEPTAEAQAPTSTVRRTRPPKAEPQAASQRARRRS